MKLLITSFVILFGLMSPSFSENTNIRILEKKSIKQSMLVNRMCVGGYEFVVLCKEYKGICFFNDQNFEITQIITEEGGGKKC